MANRMGQIIKAGGQLQGGGVRRRARSGNTFRQSAPFGLGPPGLPSPGGNSGGKVTINQPKSSGVPTNEALKGKRQQIKMKMRNIFLDRLNQGLPDYLFQGERNDYLKGLQGGRSNLQSMLARSGDQTGFAPAAALGFENAGAMGLAEMGFQQRKAQYEDPLEQVLRWRQSKRGGGNVDKPSYGADIGGMLQGIGAIAQGVGSFSGGGQPSGDTYSNDFMGPPPSGSRRVG